MKKIIFTMGALLTVGLISAQSYPKQPDKTIVNYTSYQAPSKLTEAMGEILEEQPATAKKEAEVKQKPASSKAKGKTTGNQSNTTALNESKTVGAKF